MGRLVAFADRHSLLTAEPKPIAEFYVKRDGDPFLERLELGLAPRRKVSTPSSVNRRKPSPPGLAMRPMPSCDLRSSVRFFIDAFMAVKPCSICVNDDLAHQRTSAPLNFSPWRRRVPPADPSSSNRWSPSKRPGSNSLPFHLTLPVLVCNKKLRLEDHAFPARWADVDRQRCSPEWRVRRGT